ncbi:MAG: hypothetical protein ACRDA5_01840 [Clostridium sp.]
MEEKKLGGGIITCSIIYIVFLIFGILGNIFLLVGRGFMEEALEQSGQSDLMTAISPTVVSISLAITVLLLISIILLMLKKKIGVIGTFSLVAINIIVNIVVSGFGVTILIGLILPGLLGYFVYKKRSIFGFYDADALLDDEDDDTQADL